jgi:hypothetical protein
MSWIGGTAEENTKVAYLISGKLTPLLALNNWPAPSAALAAISTGESAA